MSTLNAPMPPQTSDLVGTQPADLLITPSLLAGLGLPPRGDQKTASVIANVVASSNELAERLIDERTRRELAEIAQRQKADAEQKANAARVEKEKWEVSQLTVATATANTDALLTFLKWFVPAAAVTVLVAVALTPDTPATTSRRSRR